MDTDIYIQKNIFPTSISDLAAVYGITLKPENLFNFTFTLEIAAASNPVVVIRVGQAALFAMAKSAIENKYLYVGDITHHLSLDGNHGYYILNGTGVKG